jgi:2-polyprenyl-3-methyl-5-hydroxy-6-metoxy-1,4-benzoquinol methylase
MNYNEIVQEVIEGYKVSPIDMLGCGDASGEFTYLNNLKDTYVRTVRDVDNLFYGDKSRKNILEIGSFLGAVSISLKRLGFNVSALDIPEFYESHTLRSLYDSNGIPFNGLNLRNSILPYDSNSFDAVVICEVIEHLNFNPLRVLQDINRVLKNNGYIYVGMPNQSRLGNRYKLLKGTSISNPIDDYFKQFDKNANMVVGLHWREYTLNETIELVQKMGFDTLSKYYYCPSERYKTNALKAMLKHMAYYYPPFRPFHVVIGRKVSVPTYDFWLTDANT